MANTLVLTGRLVADPDRRELPSGTPVCQFRLAVDGLRRNRETGFVRVTSFGNGADAAARVLTKGWLVNVVGRLQEDAWQQDGQNRTTYEVIGEVEFLAAPRPADHDDRIAHAERVADEAIAAATHDSEIAS